MSKFYVYTLTNSLDNKVFYVGKGKDYRAYEHFTVARSNSPGYKLYRVHYKIRKIWKNGGEVQVNKPFETDIESEAFDEEKRLIAFYGRNNLTNLTDGGDGPSGYIMSDKQRESLRACHIGKKLSVETIAKREKTRKERNIPVWNKGKKMSIEFRAKVSAGGLGREPWNKGKSMPDWVIQKMSIAQTGKRKMSDDNKRKLIAATKGVPKSAECKQKLSASHSKPIVCIDTGEYYLSATEAAKQLGVSQVAISYAVRHGTKSCKMRWASAL